MSPNEQRAIAARFRTREQQMLNEMEQQTHNLTSLAPAMRGELEILVPQLKSAFIKGAQARADLALFG